MAPRETANNAYAKFWDDKQKVLWCVMVFSGVVNYLVCQCVEVIVSLGPSTVFCRRWLSRLVKS